MAVSQNVIEILVRARDEASRKLQQVNKVVKKNGQLTGVYQNRLKKLDKTQAQLNKANTLTAKNLKKVRQQFDMSALSVMFFGMAMMRVAKQIWTAGTKTFQDVMHSVEGTVTQFDMLNASGDMLKYSLGAALEPLAAMLIPIVTNFADWVSEHEGLVRTIVAFLAISGGLLTAYGTIRLGVQGINSATTVLLGNFKSLGNWFKVNFPIAMNASVNAVKKLIASIGTLKANMIWIQNNPITTIVGTAALVGIGLAINKIGQMMKDMGGWEEFVKSAGRMVLRLLALVNGAIGEIINAALLGINTLLNGAITKLNVLIRAVNAVSSRLGLGTIGEVDYVQFAEGDFGETFRKAMQEYTDWESSSWLAPDQGYLNNLGTPGNQYGSQIPVVNNNYYYNPSSDEISISSIQNAVAQAQGGVQ